MHAGIQRQVGCARPQDRCVRPPRIGFRVAVHRGVGSRVSGAELISRGQRVVHQEGPRSDPPGQPGAVGVGARHGRQIRMAVVHLHQHVRNPRFAAVLDPVAVPVVPDPVADLHVQIVLEKHHSAADQVQAAIFAARRRVGREDGAVGHVRPIRAIGADVVAGQRIPVDEVVGLEPQGLPGHEDARQRLGIHDRRRMQHAAVFRITLHDRGIDRNSRIPPVRIQHADRRAERRRTVVSVQRRDGRDLEAVVSAAVHHQKPALIDVVEHRKPVGKNVVDAFDVVVVAVAVAGVGKHVVRPAVHDRPAQRSHHGGRITRPQKNVRARLRIVFVQHDVEGARRIDVVHAFKVDDVGQHHEVVSFAPHLEPRQDQVVLSPLVEADSIAGPRREIPSPARRRIVVVRVGKIIVGSHDAGNRLLSLHRPDVPAQPRPKKHQAHPEWACLFSYAHGVHSLKEKPGNPASVGWNPLHKQFDPHSALPEFKKIMFF